MQERKKVLFKFKNVDEAAQRCANELAQVIANLAESQDQVVIALCGGSSPSALYSALVNSIATLHETTRSKLRYVPLDERCVEENNPDHNLASINEQLFEPLAKCGAMVSWQICWYHQQDDNHKEALEDFSEKFSSIGAQIDVVIAGAGPDGHIASLFPAHDSVLNDSSGYFIVEDSPKPPPTRITASRTLISKAAVVVGIFLKGKEEAFANFQTTHTTIEKDCPAKILNEYNPVANSTLSVEPTLYVLTDIF